MEEISVIGLIKGSYVIAVWVTNPDLGNAKWYIRIEETGYTYCLNCTVATTFSSTTEAEEFLRNNKTVFKPIVGWSLQNFIIEKITTIAIESFIE